MIRSLLHHLPFFAVSAAVMVLLCFDVGQGQLACEQARTVKKATPRTVEVVQPPAAKKSKPHQQRAVAKKALEDAQKRHEKERAEAQLRIKKLEQRMARMQADAQALMAKVAADMRREAAARAAAEAARTAAEAARTTTEAAQTTAEAALAASQAEQTQQQAAREAAARAARKAAAQQAALDKQLAAAAAERERLTAQLAATEARRADAARRQAAADAERRKEAERRDRESAALRRQVTQQQAQLAAERQRREALERRVAGQGDKLAAQRRRLAELSTQPAPRRAQPGAGAKKAQKVDSWRGYLEFLAPVNAIALDKDGADLPMLDVDHRAFSDNLVSIMRFYQMGFYGLVIYPERNEKDPRYLKIDVSGGVGRARFQTSSDATEIDRLASIGRLWNGLPIGRALLARIRSEQAIEVPKGAYLALLNLFPRSTAQYFIWKRIEVCKRNGIEPAKVNRCLSTFRRTRFGTWVVIIDRVELKDGRVVAVKDFEAARVALAPGKG